jgi:cytoplasmic iron level regulating protein YaaA (DUF328/UPF0246 family)
MKILLAPAKNLDLNIKNPIFSSQPIFQEEIKSLIEIMKKKSTADLSKLMKISPKLADLNFKRYQDFQNSFNDKNSIPAILTFNGDAYQNLDKDILMEVENTEFAQQHLLIISGLYGFLRPFDLIQPYRLEMGIKLQNLQGKNLYEFWQKKLTDFLNSNEDDFIINLASSEYSQVINQKNLKAKLINIIFKEKKLQSYKIIGISAKKSRGKMLDFIIKQKIRKSESLKDFNKNGYNFREDISDDLNYYFYRENNT